jgi:hypothetical protein
MWRRTVIPISIYTFMFWSTVAITTTFAIFIV